MELNGSAQQADTTTTDLQHLDTADTGSQVKFELPVKFAHGDEALFEQMPVWIDYVSEIRMNLMKQYEVYYRVHFVNPEDMKANAGQIYVREDRLTK